MYDGPAFNWHGELDMIPFTVDKWPWEPIGFSMIEDGWELQKAVDVIDRGTMDKVIADLDRPLGYDMNAVSKREAMEFDPMERRGRIAYDGSMVDKPFTSPVPEEVYRIQESTLRVRENFQNELDYITQTRDIVELGKARALGKGMDQLEALISAQGPIVKDISRNMEMSLGRVGSQVGWLILQYMDTGRIMQYVGPENMVQEIFDYDPSSIVPSHMPGENPVDSNQQPIPSAHSRLTRARWFAGNLRFFLLPHSVHEMEQMTERLLLLQLRQRGAPISWSTIMKACSVPDTADPKSGSTEQERFYSEKEDEISHMARLQQILKSMGIEGPPGGAPHAGGRPPTGQAPPKLTKKGDGRPVISESH